MEMYVLIHLLKFAVPMALLFALFMAWMERRNENQIDKIYKQAYKDIKHHERT